MSTEMFNEKPSKESKKLSPGFSSGDIAGGRIENAGQSSASVYRSVLDDYQDREKIHAVVDNVTIYVQDILQDLRRYLDQSTLLAKFGLPLIAVKLIDYSDTNIPNNHLVPLDIGLSAYDKELDDVSKKLQNAAEETQNSGLEIEEILNEEATKSFIKATIGTIELRTLHRKLGGENSNLVVVRSNRNGDRVLFAKGHFFSTQSGFGHSNPATNHLPAGRYCFGIAHSSGSQFDNVLWSVPNNNVIPLQLP